MAGVGKGKFKVKIRRQVGDTPNSSVYEVDVVDPGKYGLDSVVYVAIPVGNRVLLKGHELKVKLSSIVNVRWSDEIKHASELPSYRTAIGEDIGE